MWNWAKTISHNFSFVHNAAIFSLEDGDSMFLQNVYQAHLKYHLTLLPSEQLKPWTGLLGTLDTASNQDNRLHKQYP
jgi:hypothetical protein